MKNNKLPASLEGLLEKVQQSFLDLERQEKRILAIMKKRDEELSAKRVEEGELEDSPRSLKEIEVIDNLHSKDLNLINSNNKNKIDLLKFYGSAILKNADQLQEAVEETESSSNSSLSEQDFDDIRKHLKFNIKP
jgi:hypothetical protein